MRQIHAFQLESVVLNFLVSAFSQRLVQQPRVGLDFEVTTSSGARVLVELQGRRPNLERVASLVRQAAMAGRAPKQFVLISPRKPDPSQRDQFTVAFEEFNFECRWIELSELPAALGVPSPGDLSSPEVQAKLQVASVLKSIERYDGAPIGSLGLDEGGTDVDEIDRLSRQFGHRVIGRLSGMDVSIEEALKIATRVSGITIVLSDLINFSTLVASSTPDDLQEAMGRYYRLAREAVFRNGGMLDKFIGDSVLAVFGYPFAAERDTISAISFSLELVQIGGEVLGSWIDNLNHDIATGTRVGLATGEIWPINIGGPALEVALLGDTINLAARLEKNCGTNGLLMDQRTKAKAEKEDPAFTKGLGLVPKTIPVEAAKGQMAPVKAWGFAEVVHLADCK